MGKMIQKPNLYGKSIRLLRSNGQDISDYTQPRKSNEAQEYNSRDYDDEDFETPIVYAAFENAFKDYKERLRNTEIFLDSDAISSELAYNVDPEVLFKYSLKLKGAEPEMKQITQQINEYKRKYAEALDTIDKAKEVKVQESEINSIKSALFSAIVRSFDDYTTNLGDATYEYALKALYDGFMQIAKFRGRYALDIFDYFSMSDADPEYRSEVYEELIDEPEIN